MGILKKSIEISPLLHNSKSVSNPRNQTGQFYKFSQKEKLTHVLGILVILIIFCGI
jgi:hypothetical protein